MFSGIRISCAEVNGIGMILDDRNHLFDGRRRRIQRLVAISMQLTANDAIGGDFHAIDGESCD
jgi:hypothetical protein